MTAHLLFVDDDERFLAGLRRTLHACGEEWVMTFVGSVDEALDCMHATPVDTVVSDVQMPGRDGFDLLEAIGSSPVLGHVPVVMMTGGGECNLKRRALELGAADLLNKPFDTADLIARVRSALRVKAYHDQIRGQNDLLERKVRERTKALDAARIDLIWRLGTVAEFRDEETGNHILRVGSYCKVLAETLGMSSVFAEAIFLTGPLHDVGKIGIPDRILLKPGKLDEAEWEVMKRHCTIGANILRAHDWPRFVEGRQGGVRSREESDLYENSSLAMASSIALSHHEWWDGSGYPHRLAGEKIPLEARIVAVADVYDALSSARPYKPAFPETVVLNMMAAQAGTHFDPAVYEGFRRVLPAFRDILSRLSDHSAAA
jgi:putative two-component system response regulator